MTVKMLDAFNDSFTFFHIRACSQGDGIAGLSVVMAAGASDNGVGLMGIAPGRASVDKRFELSGNIRPVRGGNTDNGIRPRKFRHNFYHVIVLNASGRLMTASAAFAELNVIIVNANTPDVMSHP